MALWMSPQVIYPRQALVQSESVATSHGKFTLLDYIVLPLQGTLLRRIFYRV